MIVIHSLIFRYYKYEYRGANPPVKKTFELDNGRIPLLIFSVISQVYILYYKDFSYCMCYMLHSSSTCTSNFELLFWPASVTTCSLYSVSLSRVSERGTSTLRCVRESTEILVLFSRGIIFRSKGTTTNFFDVHNRRTNRDEANKT